jgi:Polyketide cyclase / dehydrase and lipid transport
VNKFTDDYDSRHTRSGSRVQAWKQSRKFNVNQRKVSMIRIVLIALAAVVAALVAIVAIQPSAFRIARTATISAPAQAVFAQVNDFHNWQAWSPWEGIDPALKRDYQGPAAGTGAVYSWTGNNRVGEGRMTIIESRPSDLIRIRLEFLKPFAATHTAEFIFKPEGDNTAVTWSMSGANNFVAKGIGLFMNIDKMLGNQFEKGLAQLGSAAEAAAPEK